MITEEYIKSTVKSIFEKSDIICCDTSAFVNRDNHFDENDINLSSIVTMLIQETGRWVEAYASDLFFTWDEVCCCINRHMKTTELLPTETFMFGLRKNGVDHNAFVISRINNPTDFNNDFYRKVYAVQILDYKDDDEATDKHVIITLKDVTIEVNSEAYHIRTHTMFNRNVEKHDTTNK